MPEKLTRGVNDACAEDTCCPETNSIRNIGGGDHYHYYKDHYHYYKLELWFLESVSFAMTRIRPVPTVRLMTAAIALASLVFAAPSNAQRPEPPPLDGAVELIGRSLTTPNSLNLPVALGVFGGQLVVLDAGADSVVLVLSVKSGALIARFGRRGDGPGEFRAPAVLDAKATEAASFWVLDAILRRLTRYTLPSRPKKEGMVLPDTMVTLETGATLVSGFWDANNRFICAGFFSHPHRFLRFDPDGLDITYFGPEPPGERKVPVAVRQHAYQTILAAHPDRNVFAAATRHSDRLDLFSIDGRLLGSARRPFSFEPKFSVQRGQRGPILATGDDLRFGYIALASTSDRVLALYSGRTRAQAPGHANFGALVFEYDWRGTLHRTFHLDHEALALTVDGSGTHLYTLTHYPVPVVREYTLPVDDHRKP